MVNFTLNGLSVSVQKGTSLLEAATFYGIHIPTLCYYEGLSPYGACRLCLVEVGKPPKSRLVTSCTYPVEEGIEVQTHSRRVVSTRALLIEMYLSICPSSRTIQDLASRHHVTQVRFRVRHDDCLMCGLCVRMCAQQMQGKAIDFTHRGVDRKIMTPFDKKSETCRLCGGCMYVCPACQARCQGPRSDEPICNACLQPSVACLETYDHAMCHMEPCVSCELQRTPREGERISL